VARCDSDSATRSSEFRLYPLLRDDASRCVERRKSTAFLHVSAHTRRYDAVAALPQGPDFYASSANSSGSIAALGELSRPLSALAMATVGRK
jgi:hypothetical protein